VILKGTVLWRRDQPGKDPAGCAVGLAPTDREKVNFLNGFVRGGLLNRREKRRLPLRLPVTYGGLDGPVETFTRDINEEGVFLLATSPLPEGTLVHFVVGFPGMEDPYELKGHVTHTVIVEDDDIPGMGVRYVVEGENGAQLMKIVDKLEADFMSGALPDEVVS
jgi:hypothetical protein